MNEMFEQMDGIEKQGLPHSNLTADERAFLRLVHDPLSRSNLLARLEKLGLLSAFLEAENETNE